VVVSTALGDQSQRNVGNGRSEAEGNPIWSTTGFVLHPDILHVAEDAGGSRARGGCDIPAVPGEHAHSHAGEPPRCRGAPDRSDATVGAASAAPQATTRRRLTANLVQCPLVRLSPAVLSHGVTRTGRSSMAVITSGPCSFASGHRVAGPLGLHAVMHGVGRSRETGSCWHPVGARAAQIGQPSTARALRTSDSDRSAVFRRRLPLVPRRLRTPARVRAGTQRLVGALSLRNASNQNYLHVVSVSGTGDRPFEKNCERTMV
jgi:hypothetical protein